MLHTHIFVSVVSNMRQPSNKRALGIQALSSANQLHKLLRGIAKDRIRLIANVRSGRPSSVPSVRLCDYGLPGKRPSELESRGIVRKCCRDQQELLWADLQQPLLCGCPGPTRKISPGSKSLD